MEEGEDSNVNTKLLQAVLGKNFKLQKKNVEKLLSRECVLQQAPGDQPFTLHGHSSGRLVTLVSVEAQPEPPPRPPYSP